MANAGVMRIDWEALHPAVADASILAQLPWSECSTHGKVDAITASLRHPSHPESQLSKAWLHAWAV